MEESGKKQERDPVVTDTEARRIAKAFYQEYEDTGMKEKVAGSSEHRESGKVENQK